jgi:hypothetical protein
MYDDETTADLNEAIWLDRMDADLLQAQYEAEGNAYARRQRRMESLRAEGMLVEAAEACNHGSGFPLDSIAASEGTTGFGVDPFAGEAGYRCVDCGSRLSGSPWDGDVTVLVPCEVIRGDLS